MFDRLQPLGNRWYHLDEEERQGLLEFMLRKVVKLAFALRQPNFTLVFPMVLQHQFLAQGSTVTLPYNDQAYTFSVLETKPSEVVSLTDTEVETEIAPPLQVLCIFCPRV